ncbi:hypothetical protein Lal_00000800 [Lupinus albus]|nr:hypothetical protein Lal_00000800 [Lupinus albus]
MKGERGSEIPKSPIRYLLRLRQRQWVEGSYPIDLAQQEPPIVTVVRKESFFRRTLKYRGSLVAFASCYTNGYC